MPAAATVTANVSIGPRDAGEGIGLEVTLDINLPGMTKEAGEDLARRGHVVCPYWHSIMKTVDVKTNVSV